MRALKAARIAREVSNLSPAETAIAFPAPVRPWRFSGESMLLGKYGDGARVIQRKGKFGALLHRKGRVEQEVWLDSLLGAVRAAEEWFDGQQ